MSTIKYYLQPNPITEGPNDQAARVVANNVYNLDDIISKMMLRGTGSSESDLRAALLIFFNVVADEVTDGNNVNLPIANFRPGITGLFNTRSDLFDPSRHVVKATVSNGLLLNQRMQSAKIERVSQPAPGPVILDFTDATTGLTNSKITPGGIGTIAGRELKFDAANAEEGIFFVNGTTTRVSVVAMRTEGKLMFNIPVLPQGSYSLEVRKAYTTAGVIRTGVLAEELQVS